MSEGRATVAIVGRPNVGKSSLFNRLLGRRKALVQDTPGVTVDRAYGITSFEDREVLLCDTGGFEETGVVAGELLARLIREQAQVAIAEADVVVHVLDIRAGLMPADTDIARRLRASRKAVITVLNKADFGDKDDAAAEFWELGVEDLVLVSAEHGRGLPDLVDAVLRALPAEPAARNEGPWDGLGKRQKPSRKQARAARAAAHGGRLHFLGEDMPSEPTTSRGPRPNAWDADVEAEADSLVLGAGDEGWEDVDGAEDGFAAADGGLDDRGALVDAIDGEGETLDSEDDVALDDGVPTHLDAGAEVGGAPVREFEPKARDAEGFVPRVAILGRPNVGKSTLLNRMLGYQRAITSPIAGTTRDALDAYVEHEGKRYVLIDTAGVRRKSRVTGRIEQLTVGRALRVIEATHLVLLVIDGSEGITEQEARLGSLAVDAGRALVLVVNKWDTQPKGEGPRDEWVAELRRRFPHLAFADIVFLSARTGRGMPKLWHAIERADTGHRLIVTTGPLTRWVRAIWQTTPPPLDHHHAIRVYYAVQTGLRPPTFQIFCSKPSAIGAAYRRFLANQFRRAFPAPGSPVRLVLVDRSGA